MSNDPNRAEDNSRRQQTKKDSHQSRRQFWRWLILHIERKMHQNRARRKKKQGEEAPEDKAARRTATATVAIAFLTLVMAGFSALTWWEIHSGGVDTKAIASGATKSATAAGDFASSASGIKNTISDAEKDFSTMAQNSSDAIKATQDAMRRDQRAWAGAMQIMGIPELNKPYEIKVIYGNTGRTPAMGIVTQAREVLIPHGVVFKPDYSGAIAFQSQSTLFPNQFLTTTLEGSKGVKLTKNDIDFIENSGKAMIYVFGRACYKDVFGQRHWDSFCVTYDPISKSYISCPTYNEIDTNKTDKKDECQIDKSK